MFIIADAMFGGSIKCEVLNDLRDRELVVITGLFVSWCGGTKSTSSMILEIWCEMHASELVVISLSQAAANNEHRYIPELE